MRVALYARYSNDRQNERSIEDQLAVCRRHAEGRGWTVVASFSDAAISASTMANRPGLLALLSAAGGGAFDLVLAEEQDRIARNLEHEAHIFNRLRHAGVRIATLATDEVGILDVAFKGLMNELYLDALSQKTRRGMRANAERGAATGSRLYGYASQPGGAMTIVEAEAQVIRRIFDDYIAGATPREIADRLNRAGVPGPRGGLWAASSVGGSRQRGNGVLYTELYVGQKVWNRMEVRKDPVSGKRLPIMRPPAEWKRTPAPDLRIVTDAAWAAVQGRKAIDGARTLTSLGNGRKPGVFSGLLKCGCCGASYTTYQRGFLICAAYREKGPTACGNRHTVRRAAVEGAALEGLRTRVAAPEAVAVYVRAYHAAWAEADRARLDRRRPAERRIAELNRAIDRITAATLDGTASRALRLKAIEHEAERDDLEAELAALDATETSGGRPPIALHPRAAERYAGLVAQLQQTLAEAALDPEDPDARQLVDQVRALITRIIITPKGEPKDHGFDLALQGDLAMFLDLDQSQKVGGPAGSWGQLHAGSPSLPFDIRLRA